MENSKEIIVDINNKLQLLITMSIFFPSVIYSLSKITNASEITSQIATVNALCLLVSTYLITYIFFEVSKNRLTKNYLAIFYWSSIVSIGSFVLPLIVISSSLSKQAMLFNGIEISISKISLGGSIYIMIIMPAVLVGTVLVGRIHKACSKK